MRVGRLISTMAAAGFATLAFASPALAATLNPAQVPTTAQQFGTHDCNAFPGGVPAGEDGWHFVLPAATSSNFVTVTLNFTTPAPVQVVISSTDPSSPSTGPGWSGYLDNAGSMEKHAYLFTTAGWTLQSGSAVTNPPSEGNFNISHTCPGSGSPSPSASMSTMGTPSTTAPATSSGAKPSGGAETGGGGSYGVTGLGVGALLLACSGGLALIWLRHRNQGA